MLCLRATAAMPGCTCFATWSVPAYAGRQTSSARACLLSRCVQSVSRELLLLLLRAVAAAAACCGCCQPGAVRSSRPPAASAEGTAQGEAGAALSRLHEQWGTSHAQRSGRGTADRTTHPRITQAPDPPVPSMLPPAHLVREVLEAKGAERLDLRLDLRAIENSAHTACIVSYCNREARWAVFRASECRPWPA